MNIKKMEYHHEIRNKTTTGSLSPQSRQTSEQRVQEMNHDLKAAGLRLKAMEQRLKNAVLNLQDAAENLQTATQGLQITEQTEETR